MVSRTPGSLTTLELSRALGAMIREEPNRHVRNLFLRAAALRLGACTCAVRDEFFTRACPECWASTEIEGLEHSPICPRSNTRE